MDEYIGMIKIFAADFAPKGWLLCQGQSMSVQTNQALFAIIGTIYGGDGITTFKLPNLQGLIPIGMGTAPSGTTYVEAQVGGSTSLALTVANLPAHTHTLTGSIAMQGNGGSADATDPGFGYPGLTGVNSYAATGDAPMGPLTSTLALAVAGASTPIDKRMPSLGVNYIICVSGLFPTRN